MERRFTFSRRSLWSQAARLVVVVAVFCFLSITAYSRAVESQPPDKVASLTGDLVLTGIVLAIGLLVNVIDLIGGFQGEWDVVVGDGWIRVPGRFRVELTSIVDARWSGSIRHPKVTLQLNKRLPVFRNTVDIKPGDYDDSAELEQAIRELLARWSGQIIAE